MLVFSKLFDLLVALASCVALFSFNDAPPPGPPQGQYEVDTVRFVLTNPAEKNADKPVPHVWIDTNTKLSGLSGGTLKSRLPYGLQLDFTDVQREYKAVEFTTVEVAYDDEQVDPRAKPPKLPLRIDARDYEMVNSVAGGQIVKSNVRILSGKIPAVVTRAEPLTLRLEGYFVENDGTKRRFQLDEHYDVEKEKTVKPAREVLQDL